MPINSKSFSRTNILVIGDIMLDRYLWGKVSRISPEAPVPIVQVKEKSEVLGGAGNVASNLSGLGCKVSVIAVCGADEAGSRLKEILKEKGVGDLLFEDKARPTITKTRVMAHHQQLFRLDEEELSLISATLQEQMFSIFNKQLKSCQVVILSDYGKGMFQTPEVCQHLIRICKKNKIPVLVDPKGKDWTRYQGATCVTPNTAELELVSGDSITADEATLLSTAHSVREVYGLDWLLVTRGSKGMCLVGSDGDPMFIPAVTREVYDVSGAGDTVIASLAAGVAVGLSFPSAAEVSNTAAGIVVGKLGTQPVTIQELSAALQINQLEGQKSSVLKLVTRDAAKIQIQAWRNSGETVVFTNGCFDLLHPGHITLLHQARDMGDRLVIGLNTDASVRRLKGKERPILSERDRGAILSALGCVDMVVLFDEDTPLALIKMMKPDILVKGADYRPEEVVGREVVESYGGRVCLVSLLEGYSTTGIANKVRSAKKA